MRFHLGTKIGGAYVGTSVSGKDVKKGASSFGGCLLRVLLLPFLLIYWCVVCPIIFLCQYISGKPLPTWKLVIIWVLFLPITGIATIIRSKIPLAGKIAASGGIVIISLLIILFGGSSSEPDQMQAVASIEATASPVIASAIPTAAIVSTPQATPTAAPPEALEPLEGYVNADELYMRDTPSSNGEIINTYTYGQPLSILGEESGWYHVSIDGQEGYMSADYVSEGEAPATTPTPAQASQQGAAPAATATPVPQATPTAEPIGGYTIYITPTGKRYHYDGNCNGGKYEEATLEEAIARGLTPCGKCVN